MNTLGLPQEHGSMNRQLLLKWLQLFRKFANSSVLDKVLLIVDGHPSHNGIEALTFAIDERNYDVKSFSSLHASYAALGCSFFFLPINIYYNYNFMVESTC